jgi:hypothetical protein
MDIIIEFGGRNTLALYTTPCVGFEHFAQLSDCGC